MAGHGLLGGMGAKGEDLLRHLQARPPLTGEVTILIWNLNDVLVGRRGTQVVADIPEELWTLVDAVIRHLLARGPSLLYMGDPPLGGPFRRSTICTARASGDASRRMGCRPSP